MKLFGKVPVQVFGWFPLKSDHIHLDIDPSALFQSTSLWAADQSFSKDVLCTLTNLNRLNVLETICQWKHDPDSAMLLFIPFSSKSMDSTMHLS